MSETPSIDKKPFFARLAVAGFVLFCAWAYWPTLLRMGRTWASNPEYSHGFLVPLFSAWLLYSRRALCQQFRPELSAWGPAALALAGILRIAGGLLGMDYLDSLSLVACIAGLFVLFGGLAAMRWAWPSLLFLLFMIPLPYGLATSLSGMLRTIATQASGFVLQMIGYAVVIDGHTLLVGEHRIAVAEACSGLSMLYVFLALATAVAILVERPWLDRAIVLASAIPIAVAANVARIAATAFAFQAFGKKAGEFIYHDLAGWLMMPLALGLLMLVLRLLDAVLVPETETGPPAVPGFGTPADGRS